jgi:serine protease inhibitor
MAKSQLRSIIANAQTVHDMLEDETNIAEWVQSKITLSADYMSTVRDYMQSNKEE